MKRSIIFLGLAALTFTTVNAANEFKTQDIDQQEFAVLDTATLQENQLALASGLTTGNTGTDITVFNPDTVIQNNYVKTVEDVIRENKLITESKEENFQPLSLGYTIEDRITEDNQIIESTVSNEIFPLDFEKINNKVACVKTNNNAIKTADLKL